MSQREAVVVAEAEDAVEAGIWIDALAAAGIDARTFERGVGAALGGAATAGFARYPVIVSREDIGSARSVIAECGGAASLAPVREQHEVRASQRQALTTVGIIVGGIVALAVLARLTAG